MYDSKITFVFEQHIGEIEGGLLSSEYRLIRSHRDFWNYYRNSIAWYNRPGRDIDSEKDSYDWSDLCYYISEINPDLNLCRYVARLLDTDGDVAEYNEITFEYRSEEYSVEYFEDLVAPLKHIPYWRLATVEHTTIR